MRSIYETSCFLYRAPRAARCKTAHPNYSPSAMLSNTTVLRKRVPSRDSPYKYKYVTRVIIGWAKYDVTRGSATRKPDLKTVLYPRKWSKHHCQLTMVAWCMCCLMVVWCMCMWSYTTCPPQPLFSWRHTSLYALIGCCCVRAVSFDMSLLVTYFSLSLQADQHWLVICV